MSGAGRHISREQQDMNVRVVREFALLAPFLYALLGVTGTITFVFALGHHLIAVMPICIGIMMFCLIRWRGWHEIDVATFCRKEAARRVAFLRRASVLVSIGCSALFVLLIPFAGQSEMIALGNLIALVCMGSTLCFYYYPTLARINLAIILIPAISILFTSGVDTHRTMAGMLLLVCGLVLIMLHSVSQLVDNHVISSLREARRAAREKAAVDALLCLSQRYYFEINRDGRLTRVSDDLADLIGRPAPSLLGRKLHILVDWNHPQNRFAIDSFTEGMVRGDPVVDLETVSRPVNGERRITLTSAMPIHDDEARVIGYRGWITDITERRRQAEDLQESAARFRDFATLAAECLWETDAEHCFTSVLGNTALLTGLDDKGVVGQRPFILDALDDIPERYRDDHAQLLNCLERRVPFDNLLIPTRNGRVVMSSAIPRFSDDDHFLGYRGYSKDVTDAEEAKATAAIAKQQLVDSNAELERRVAERTADLAKLSEDLRAARDEAEAANEAKSQFLAAMSHEIRTPMNGVLGMTEVLIATALNNQQRELTEVIQRSGESLLNVINDILDFSKISASKMALAHEPFSPLRAVEDVIRLLEPEAAGKGVAIDMTVPDDLPSHFMGDEGRFRQIVTNLVGNAVKFTDQGQVDVKISQTPRRDGRIDLAVDVIDTGCGIADESLEKVFETFSQADHGKQGTGLGLPISRDLARLQGGDIRVESALGKGSRFMLRLPLALATRRDVIGSEVAQQFSSQKHMAESRFDGLRILVAEDNSVNQMVIRAMLDGTGCTLTFSQNGRDAVDMIKTDPPDMVLMDVSMPIMDGYAATEAVRAFEAAGGARQRLPIIGCTAHAMEEDRTRCLGAGMDDVISKPLARDSLVEMIDRWKLGQVVVLQPAVGS